MKKLITTLFLILATAVWAGDFEAGAAAYKKGDYKTAMKLWKPMAEKGNAYAQYALGEMYEYGNGVSEDDKQAVKWYRLTAERGLAGAQYSLGIMYRNGDGVTENHLTAYVWMSVAAARGNQLAKDNIAIVKKSLTNEQLAQGQVLASKCFESFFEDCP